MAILFRSSKLGISKDSIKNTQVKRQAMRPGQRTFAINWILNTKFHPAELELSGRIT